MNDGTLKVTPIESKRPQATATHVISYMLDGFPITTTIETTATITEVITRLKTLGATPPNATPAEQLAAKVGAPVCPTHNVPMLASTKRNGSYFCPKKADDGGYCRHKA